MFLLENENKIILVRAKKSVRRQLTFCWAHFTSKLVGLVDEVFHSVFGRNPRGKFSGRKLKKFEKVSSKVSKLKYIFSGNSNCLPLVLTLEPLPIWIASTSSRENYPHPVCQNFPFPSRQFSSRHLLHFNLTLSKSLELQLNQFVASGEELCINTTEELSFTSNNINFKTMCLGWREIKI